MSRQQTIKYLGKASHLTIQGIPKEFRDNTKILAFVSAFSSYQEEKEVLVSRIQEELFVLLTECNVTGLVDLYQKYCKLFSLTEFYGKLLKPVIYRVGDLWQHGLLDVATEHASTNTAISLVNIKNERIAARTRPIQVKCEYKAVICTPYGELHGLACNMIESLLLNSRFKVYNISTSIPTDYIVNYINNLQPDIVFVSITLAENIKSAVRLVQQIYAKYDNKVPIMVGGSALSNVQQHEDCIANAFVIKDASFEEIMKLIKISIVQK
jgi:methanogenic corrinoid protein MtbC1